MKIIPFNVDDQVADAYNKATGKEKKKMNELVNSLLAEALRKNQLHLLFEAMDQVSAQAKASGLTGEKLAELMEWDEQTKINLFGESYKHG